MNALRSMTPPVWLVSALACTAPETIGPQYEASLTARTAVLGVPAEFFHLSASWESGLSVFEGAAIAVLAFLIVGLAFERHRQRAVERELQRRLQFETLISELSWNVGTGSGESVLRTTGWLQRLSNCLEADRVSLLAATKGRVNGTSSAPRISSWVSGPAYPAAEFPALTELIAHGEVVRFSSLEMLPSALARDRQSFKRYGVESALLIPLRHHESLLGALAFTGSSPRTWPNALVERLQFVGSILGPRHRGCARHRGWTPDRGDEWGARGGWSRAT